MTWVFLVALGILGVLIYLLSGGTFFQRETIIRTYMPDAAGLAEGSAVRLNGVLIGKIKSIALSGSKDLNRVVKVQLRIGEKYLSQLPDDSFAAIDAEDVLGAKLIDITKGTSSRSLRANGEVLFQPAPPLLKTIDLPGLEAKMRAVDALLRDIEAGKGSVGQFVMGDKMYRDVLDRVSQVQKGISAAASTTSNLGRLLYSDTLYNQISAPIQQLDDKLAALQAGQGRGGRFLKDPALYDNMRAQVAEIRRRLEGLRAGPNGAFLQSDELYVKWNTRLASLIREVDELNSGQGAWGQLLVSSQLYESLNGASREMQSAVKDFRENPQKFLRLKLF